MKYLGIPYREHGRNYSGCDCYGFVRMVLADHDIEIPAYNFHGNGEEKETALELFQTEKQESPGDLDLIYLSSPGWAEHVGIYMKGMVWQMTGNGVISRPWKRIQGQVKGVYRVV